MQSKFKIQKYSYLSRIILRKQVMKLNNDCHCRNYPFLRSFLSSRILVSSYSRLMEYAARKSNTTSILLTLCPGYKLFTPSFKSAYLSLLKIVLVGMQTVPSIMNHSFFTLSITLISGLLAPFLGHFSRCHGISHKIFALSFSKHGIGWLCLYHG